MRYLFLTIILLSMIVNDAYAQKSKNRTNYFTIEDIWGLIEENNKNLKRSKLELDRREQIIRSAKSDYLPDIQIDATYNRNTKMPVYKESGLSSPEYFPIGKYGYGVGYELNLDIYDGGKRHRNIRKRKEESKLAEYQHEAKKGNIKLITATLYYELLKNFQVRDLIEQEIQSDKLQLKTIEDFFNNGIVLKSDVLRASVRLSHIELSLSEVNNSIALVTQKLNLLIGRDESEPVLIDYTEIPLQVNKDIYEDCLALAFKENYSYKIASERINISKIDIQQSKANILPKISLFSYYNFKFPQTSLYPYSRDLYGFGQIGVKLTVPIDAFYKNNHKVNANRFLYEQERINKEILKDELSEDIKSYYLQLNYLEQRIEIAQKNIERVTESVRVIKNAYYNQQLTLTDLLDAETQLLEAKFEYTSAQINKQIVYLQLKEIIGIL